MENQGLVSVIMGVFNAEKTLTESIESILAQTYTKIEFIICDDGSTDGTAARLLDFSQRDSRIKLVPHQKNRGLAAALNTCLEAAKGEYIVRQDADDISHTDRIEKMLQFLDQSGADFAASGVNLIDRGEVWGRRIFPQTVTARTLGKYNAFMHPAMIFKKAALDDVGGYRNVFRSEDYDLVARLYGAGKFGINNEEVLVDYFEDKNSYKKHSLKSRLSEFKLRLRLVRILRLPFYYYFYSIKPLLLLLIPRCIYKRLHNKKWQRS